MSQVAAVYDNSVVKVIQTINVLSRALKQLSSVFCTFFLAKRHPFLD